MSLLLSLLHDNFGEGIETVAVFDTLESAGHSVVHAVLESGDINIETSLELGLSFSNGWGGWAPAYFFLLGHQYSIYLVVQTYRNQSVL